MFRKKRYRKVMLLSLAFALAMSSFSLLSGQAEAASAMDLFKRVYKQATGAEFNGFHSGTKTKQPVQPQPVEVSQPDPVETPQPELPETGSDELQPSEPVQPEPVQPVNPQPVESQPDPEQETEPADHSSVADKIIKTGEKYLGTPYKYGAPYGQTNTFDCSSFTKTVFAENGITLPRSSRQQAQVGTPVSKNNLQKGDLIFTSTSYSSNISHVAIYAGNGKVLHTYGPGGVRYDTFKGSWLDRAFITARRVID